MLKYTIALCKSLLLQRNINNNMTTIKCLAMVICMSISESNLTIYKYLLPQFLQF